MHVALNLLRTCILMSDCSMCVVEIYSLVPACVDGIEGG
jgi:hypothetical protein